MELVFETREAILDIKGRVHFFQEEPEIMPKPVMMPAQETEGGRITANSVVLDAGVFKMWYWAFPDNQLFPAYAESKDGINWYRPDINIAPHQNGARNFLDFISPISVYMDQDAEPDKRYRGVGYLNSKRIGDNPRAEAGFYHSFYSSDGLHWEVESSIPRTGDTITATYHPGRNCAIGAFKKVRRINGLQRRTIWTAPIIDGKWSKQNSALIPDLSDDFAARERGAFSADYYRMGILPANKGCVGFVETFWHTMPYSMSPIENYAIYGTGSITLAYQEKAGDRWLNMPGRKSFIDNNSLAWTKGWIQTTNTPIEVGDEHWLYFTGSPFSHAMHLDTSWNKIQELEDYRNCNNDWGIGIAKWPKWRMFGCSTETDGIIEIDLGKSDSAKKLYLNFKTENNGHIHLALKTRKQGEKIKFLSSFSLDESIALSGNSIREEVKWKNGSNIPKTEESNIIAEIHISNASLYAWEFVK